MIKISLDDFNKNFESKSSSINENTANYIIKKRNEDYKNKKTNYWIHGILFEHLKDVDKGLNFNKDMETKRYLGAKKENSILKFKSKDSNEMKEISPNDKIIIFTTFEKKIHNFEKGIYFIAYTEVDNVISIDEELYG
ncbi:MAG: hypothetical protein LBR15_04795, partial [Methanobrevibacter sp.]|nr:hypothetical protein [Candidatus Methanovirga australis]